MVKKEVEKKNTANNTQRTVKISAETYQMLSHHSKKEKKPMEEIASEIICAALSADQNVSSHGEHYDKDGKRIFHF